jgi:hypothetical protein
MRRRFVSLAAIVLLTVIALSVIAAAAGVEELESGVVCRFDQNTHDEWGYWKPDGTDVGHYILLGWTWTNEDGTTGYSVTDDEGNQAGALTLDEFEAYIAPYLEQPLPYGCPPLPLCNPWVFGPGLDGLVAAVGGGVQQQGDLYGDPDQCDCAGVGGRWQHVMVLQDSGQGAWMCIVGELPN